MRARYTSVGLLVLLSPFVFFILTAGEEKGGPVAKYTFDEGSGSRVADSSGNHNDGAVVGAARWVDGMRGKALLFDGVNRVSIPSSAKLNLTYAATVVAWVRGQGGKFRIVKEPSSYSSVRGPFFQVCGDTIYFATNSDHSSRRIRSSPTTRP